MQHFDGFPPGKTHLIGIPERFFTELLPAIDDGDELKLTLYFFWALQQQEGDYRYVLRREIAHDQRFLAGLEADHDHALSRLDRALSRAVERGTLLETSIDTPEGAEPVYFMNTVRGRNAIQAIAEGRFEVGDDERPIGLIVDRPNVFMLYEQNIGPLTPMIADELRDAEQEYPAHWIAEAIQLAVERNARNWRYVSAILRRWQSEGKDRGISQQSTQADRYRYIRGELSDLVDF